MAMFPLIIESNNLVKTHFLPGEIIDFGIKIVPKFDCCRFQKNPIIDNNFNIML